MWGGRRESEQETTNEKASPKRPILGESGLQILFNLIFFCFFFFLMFDFVFGWLVLIFLMQDIIIFIYKGVLFFFFIHMHSSRNIIYFSYILYIIYQYFKCIKQID